MEAFLDLGGVCEVKSVAFGDVIDLPDGSPAAPGHFGGELSFDVAAVELDRAAEKFFGAGLSFVAAFSVD